MKQFILLTLLLSSPLCAGPVTATILGTGTGAIGFVTYLLGKSGQSGATVVGVAAGTIAGPAGAFVGAGLVKAADAAVNNLGDEGCFKAITTSASAAAAFGMMLPLP
jgi:hypothetical protein